MDDLESKWLNFQQNKKFSGNIAESMPCNQCVELKEEMNFFFLTKKYITDLKDNDHKFDIRANRNTTDLNCQSEKLEEIKSRMEKSEKYQYKLKKSYKDGDIQCIKDEMSVVLVKINTMEEKIKQLSMKEYLVKKRMIKDRIKCNHCELIFHNKSQ